MRRNHVGLLYSQAGFRVVVLGRLEPNRFNKVSSSSRLRVSRGSLARRVGARLVTLVVQAMPVEVGQVEAELEKSQVNVRLETVMV